MIHGNAMQYGTVQYVPGRTTHNKEHTQWIITLFGVLHFSFSWHFHVMFTGAEVDAAGGRAGYGGRASGPSRGGGAADAVPPQARSHGRRLR